MFSANFVLDCFLLALQEFNADCIRVSFDASSGLDLRVMVVFEIII